MNDTIYFILIIIFTLIIFLFSNNCRKKETHSLLSKDKFYNTKELDITDYINSSVNIFDDKIKNINSMSNNPLFKDDAKYKFGLENKNLSKDMNLFNNQLDMLMDSTLLSCGKKKENIEKNIKMITEQENQINNKYVNQFIELYNKQENELGVDNTHKQFNKFNLSEDIDKHNNLEGFENSNATVIKNEINLSIFKGKYLVLPYQYNKLNNVYLLLDDNNVNVAHTPDKLYLLSFYLLNNKILEFEVTINFKNKSLFDFNNEKISSNPDTSSNIKGIILTIKTKKIQKINNYKYLNTINYIKNILNQLGIKEGNKLMFFLVDSKFENTTRYDISENKLEETNTELYRLYNINGTTLLQLSKKSIIDKPFTSLLG